LNLLGKIHSLLLGFYNLVKNHTKIFLSRLRTAITKAISQPDVQDLLLQTLAFENANADCQKPLHPLRAQGAPLDEYIKACMDVGSESFKANLLAAALNTGIKKGQTKCYGCGKIGHMKKESRKINNKNIVDPMKKPKPPSLYPICRQGYHWANECRSRWKANKNAIQGNLQRGQTEGPFIKNVGQLIQTYPVSNGMAHSNLSQLFTLQQGEV
jgi:hypothetical protein